jgi:hypothetical protein
MYVFLPPYRFDDDDLIAIVRTEMAVSFEFQSTKLSHNKN